MSVRQTADYMHVRVPIADPPKVIHAGLLIEAGDWQFQKHWYQDFDVQQCPPWNLTVNRPNAGIFAPPPHPDKQPNKVTSS